MEDPASIAKCVEAIKTQQLHIHVLVNNAGVSMVHSYVESPTGVEKTCQTNYLGLVQLTELMTPLLEYSLLRAMIVQEGRRPSRDQHQFANLRARRTRDG